MPFTITVQPSGRTFSSNPNETLLAAAVRQDIGLPYGCKDGACGSCKCKKIQGHTEHKPHQAKALSDQEKNDGWILGCCAVAQSDVVIESHHVADANAFPIKKMPARVSSLTRVSPDVMVMRLQLPPGEAFQYHAGQYVEFLLPGGLRRAYSLANAPHTLAEQPALELHLRHLPGGQWTDHVFGGMQERAIVRIEGPFGTFFLREKSPKPMVLLASGTGFAPIKALLEHMQHQGIARSATLYWGGRRPGDLYMQDWVQNHMANKPHLRYVPVISDALPEDHWHGRTGWVHQAVLQDLPDLSGHQVYACGAPAMVDAAQKDYLAAGLPDDAFFADAFVTEKEKAQDVATV